MTRTTSLTSSRVVTGDGPYAESIRIDLRPFTLIGATTRAGLLTQPMHERFGVMLDESENLTAHFTSFDTLSRFIAGRLGAA